MNERSIFMEALEKGAVAQRSSYLDEACAGDSALRQRVQALLKSHEEAADFLGKLAPERLVEELAAQHTETETKGTTPTGGSGDEALDFLAPSEQSDSLGRLGHYEVQEIIGRGGMGIVFRALDKKLHRVVAIKVMAPQLAASATARKRFTREAQAVAAVSHDHIVTVHAVEEANGLPYLVMHYVTGESLQKRLDQRGPLQLIEIARIGMQTAAGLAAAHAQGLIHRDVKPANILLENGVERVKITDFGLARAINDASLTVSGVVAGTPQYMAPEQAAGEHVDHRADLFSLGSVLYAMATGRPPFKGSSAMAVLKRVCEETPPPIRETNPEIPEWLVAIIARLHAKDPADRFQSAGEVAELLGQGLAHLQQPALAPLPVPPSPPGREASGRKGRRRWLLAAAAILLLVGGFATTEATGVTRLAATVIRVLTPDGTLVVEVDDPEVKVTVEGDGGLVITSPGPHEIRLRPGKYRLLATKDGKPVKNELVTISRGDKRVVRVSLETAGHALAGVPFRFTPPPPGPLDQLDAAKIPATERFDWQPKELVAVLGEHRGQAWWSSNCVRISPDGKLAASCGGHAIHIWDAETLRLRALLLGHTGHLWSVAFSPDSRRLLSCGEDRIVRLWDLETGRELRKFEGHTNTVGAVDFSHDGRRLLSAGHDHTLRLWEVETGKLLVCLEGTPANNSVAFSPEGSHAITGGDDKTLHLWDLGTRREVRRFQGHAGNPRVVGFLSNGSRVLSAGHDGTLRLWDVPSGVELRCFKGHAGAVHQSDVTSDGRRFVSAGVDGTLRLWDMDTDHDLRRVQCENPLSAAAVFPDGKRALSATWDGAIRMWDLESGKEQLPRVGVGPLCYYPLGIWWPSQTAFSTDGGRLLAGMSHPVARCWDIVSGKQLPSFQMDGPIWTVAFLSDGRRVLCGGRSGVSVLDGESGRELSHFEELPWVGRFSLSRDGRRLVSARGPGLVQIWDVEKGRELWRFSGLPDPVYAVAIAADGRRAMSGHGDGSVRLYDLELGCELPALNQRGKRIKPVAFSPDGRWAAAGDDDGFVRLWDLSEPVPKPRPVPRWHKGEMASLDFAPDGKSLASVSRDGQIVLWDVEAAEKRQAWQLPGMCQAAVFAPDGRHLATTNGNGTVYILRLAKP